MGTGTIKNSIHLIDLHRVHEGKTFVVLGRGQSIQDYESIDGATVIGINRHWLFPDIRFDYGCFVDHEIVMELKELDPEQFVDRFYITVDHPVEWERPVEVPVLYSHAVHTGDYQKGVIEWDFRFRPQTWNWGSTFAIMLAAGLGASEIHMWGVDLAPKDMVNIRGGGSSYCRQRESLEIWLPRFSTATGIPVISHSPHLESVFPA